MMYRAFTSRPVRFVADAGTGLAAFLLMACLLTGTCSGKAQLSDIYSGPAHAAGFHVGEATWVHPATQAVPLAMVKSYPGQVFRGTDRTTAFMVLAAVFTLLFVANLALYRHLRSNYSSPRRKRR